MVAVQPLPADIALTLREYMAGGPDAAPLWPWINADQITEVHIESSTDGTVKSCRIKLFGEPVRELSGAELIAELLAFLQENEIKPSRRKGT